MKEPIDIRLYNQHLYKDMPAGESDESGNVWCLICSLALLYSRMFGICITPQTLNELLKMNAGFKSKSNLVVWNRLGVKPLELIFPDSKVDIKLWDKKVGHRDVAEIKEPSIISVDGLMTTKEYDSHFLFAYMKYERNKKKDLYAFDPYLGKYISVLEYYNKGSLKNSVYSIINIKKKG